MNVTAKQYANEVERYAQNGLQEYIDAIRDYTNDGDLKIIVDIGCGPGKITTLLSERLVCDKVIGIDLQQEMINFANANKQSNSNIEFFSQDITLEWDHLRPELKLLEAQVSLVFSNFAFHWIKEKENAIKNIYRLLSRGGIFFVNIVVVPDPLNGLNSNSLNSDYNIISNILKIPSKQQQYNDWLNLLNMNGLVLEKSELFDFEFSFHHDFYQNILRKMYLKLISLYVLLTKETEIEQFLRTYSDFLVNRYDQIATKVYNDEETDEKMVTLSGTRFMTIAVKQFE